jgi:hypothetical protein
LISLLLLLLLLLLQVAGQKQQTAVMPHTRSPTYNAHFEFFNVTVPDTLQVQVRRCCCCIADCMMEDLVKMNERGRARERVCVREKERVRE